tara:strand:- start:217 stop:705 length:489 start_codon:yes stop_codon:yes gene_type:complete
MSWTNSDGLYVRFGTEKAEVAAGGSFASNTGSTVLEIDLVFGDFLTAASVVDYNQTIPSGAFIEKIEIMTTTACVGSTCVVNVGLIRKDLTTELDYNGLIAALPITSFNAAGETVTVENGHAQVGALVGTATANAGIVTVDWDTAAMTAGAVTMRIFYHSTA